MANLSLAQRLAVCSWSLQPKDPADLIGQLRQLGMDKIQLALGPLVGEPAWAGAGAKLSAAGVKVVSGMFGTVGEDYTTLETIRKTGGVVPDATWDENWRNIQRYVQVAAKLKLKLVSFHCGFLPEDAADASYDKLIGRLVKIADVFAREGIGLAMETGQEDADTLKGFLDRLAKPNVGVNFDPANMILYAKGEPVSAVKVLMPYVMQVHIKDATATKVPGQWGAEVPVGTGEVDWAAFFAALKAGGFGGCMSIEREAGQQRIADITRAKNFILDIIGKAG
jgi:sugar phosphate isomerase/epimerase